MKTKKYTKKGWMKDKCPFTFSHTRDWCGYKKCRES